MTPSHPHITAAILIGGASARMGSPKHLLQLPTGQSFLHAIADALFHITPSLVTLGSVLPLPPFNNLPDIHPNLGPLAGIHALLSSLRACDYLLCPCDSPRLTPDLLRLLLVPSSALISAFQFTHENHPQSLPIRISSAALPLVNQALHSSDHSLRALFRLAPPHLITLPDSARPLLANINTPSDFLECFPPPPAPSASPPSAPPPARPASPPAPPRT